MKPGTTPLRSIRLMDQVRERIRYLHYSLSIEKTYLYWIRFFTPISRRWQERRELPALTRQPRDQQITKSTLNRLVPPRIPRRAVFVDHVPVDRDCRLHVVVHLLDQRGGSA